MEADIKAGCYLEHGEYDGNLYGTKNDSIHEVVEAGRICILDVSPQVRDSLTKERINRCCFIVFHENHFFFAIGPKSPQDIRVFAVCGVHQSP